MNKILVTLLALIGGSCISFAQMETGRVSDTAEDTLRIENEIVAVDTGFYQSVVRYDTVRYNLKMQSVLFISLADTVQITASCGKDERAVVR